MFIFVCLYFLIMGSDGFKMNNIINIPKTKFSCLTCLKSNMSYPDLNLHIELNPNHEIKIIKGIHFKKFWHEIDLKP